MKNATKRALALLLCVLLCTSTFSLFASASETHSITCSKDTVLQHGYYRVDMGGRSYLVKPNPDSPYDPIITSGTPLDEEFTPVDGLPAVAGGTYFEVNFFPEKGTTLLTPT